MAEFILSNWDNDDTNPGKYILNGWKGSPAETEIYIPGEYNGRQISLKNLEIFPPYMTQLQLEEVNSKKVQVETTDLSGSFENNFTVINLDLSGLDTSQVINMRSMFSSCQSLTSLDVSHFQTENVTDMGQMFSGCSGLTSLDVSHFRTENITDMSYMFSDCPGLKSLDLNQFQTENVTDMGAMFIDCKGLKIVDLSQCQWTTVPDDLFNFLSDVPLIVISPAEGIKNYDFSKLRPLSMMNLMVNKGSFSDHTKKKAEYLDRYVYESRETLETAIRNLQDTNHPCYPTYFFLQWDPESLISIDPLEKLWNQANNTYTAVWWPSDVKLRSRFYL